MKPSKPVIIKTVSRELLVFGYAAGDDHAPVATREMSEFAKLLGDLAQLDVTLAPIASYEELARRVHKSSIDLAWLSPIPYLALSRSGGVVAIASLHRETPTYDCAIVVHARSRTQTPHGLAGKRAAWVDRHSAAGFVVPRIQLAAMGLNPRYAFTAERFFGSHEAVVQAVAKGDADFGATWARREQRGVLRGPWSTMPAVAADVRVLTTFGEIPADVIAAKADMKPTLRARVAKALFGMTRVGGGAEVVRAAFGADGFAPAEAKHYEPLRSAVTGAVEDGLLEATPSEEIVRSDPDRTLKMPRKSRPGDRDHTLEIRPSASTIPDKDEVLELVPDDDDDEA